MKFTVLSMVPVKYDIRKSKKQALNKAELVL